MLTIYSDKHRLHHAKVELIRGKFVPVVEMPRRADMILKRIDAVGLGPLEMPESFGLDPVHRIHPPHFTEFLRTAWDEWEAAHGDEDDALPTNWLVRGLRSDRVPKVIDGKLAHYAGDAGTPITEGTWAAVTASADVALTGAKRLGGGRTSVFSLCRPPGHHASADVYNGYCFLNNAAIAAQWLRDNGAARVAILDVDYHHGNGTQDIFYDRDDVLFVSIHADPDQEYPYLLGFADETGRGRGEGFNLNLPLPWGTKWPAYAEAINAAAARIREFGADVLVVSLGADTFQDDPISHFKLTSEDFSRIGEAIGALGLPTHVVMEGGYAVEALGINVVNLLTALEARLG